MPCACSALCDLPLCRSGILATQQHELPPKAKLLSSGPELQLADLHNARHSMGRQASSVVQSTDTTSCLQCQLMLLAPSALAFKLAAQEC